MKQIKKQEIKKTIKNLNDNELLSYYKSSIEDKVLNELVEDELLKRLSWSYRLIEKIKFNFGNNKESNQYIDLINNFNKK